MTDIQNGKVHKSKEQVRLENQGSGPVPEWDKWGPYVSERAWGTVREDYSTTGDAWNYFTFDQSHTKAYRWGEDGIAGICDRYQVLVLAQSFWNGEDSLLKERLFGLSGPEGNHGEDVKEYYYYLDATPTHSYLKYLYKYPHAKFPYEKLKKENKKRKSNEAEYELEDTGVFEDSAYFDIFIEYAKASPEDICIKIEAFNRGEKAASLHIIPHLWFRNQWSQDFDSASQPKIVEGGESVLLADDSNLLSPSKLAFDYHLGKRYLYGSEGGESLFTNNESSNPNQLYSKDAFHRHIIKGENSVNPNKEGTKSCLHYFFEEIPSGKSAVVYLRLSSQKLEDPISAVESIVAMRKKEADEFYEMIHPASLSGDEKLIQRQALSGMIWNKQFYFLDVNVWLNGADPKTPKTRNLHWRHLNSMRIILMPDKWEYPWFAAWDLSFHCLPLGLVDMKLAKDQLWLLLFDQFQHPNGAIPAYEWEFSDLNPPVQAWAVMKIYQMDGSQDYEFLEKCFLKLLLNFTFWVNKVDKDGYNVFEGGFLGLDNITVLDRSISVKDATLKQSDGTGWMGMFCLNLMRIALELAKKNATYEAMATKFFQHFVYIADAMLNTLWDDEDGFFHDMLVFPDGKKERFKIRSIVGLIPLFSVDAIDDEELNELPEFKKNFLWFITNRKRLTEDCVAVRTIEGRKSYLLSIVNQERLQKVLQYVWDPEEFRSPFGLRSLSKFHEKNPFQYEKMKVGYEPGESLTNIKGGNSNWRGPIWMPINYLLIDSLKLYAMAYPEIKIGNVSIHEMAKTFANSLVSLYTKNNADKRTIVGSFRFADDPYFRDCLPFHEYYHAETGQGLGSFHQTGWSGLIANLIMEFRV